MATLQSPGVQVQVIDESFYTPSSPGTVPMLFVTSAQDKTNPSGSTALGTTAANVGKVWLLTSQRDLTDTFGTPLFYTDLSNNPLHGDELNEYGLQAAYSLLGASSRCYVVRADVNTTQLFPYSSAPAGDPAAGQYWVDTGASLYGVKEWDNTSKKFTVRTPLVLNDDSAAGDFNGSAPNNSFGTNSEFCMVVTKAGTANKLYYKTGGSWQVVQDTFAGGKNVTISPHYTYPDTSSWTTGDVWITTTTPSNGANWSIKQYNASTAGWSTISATPLYETTTAANTALGANIPIGTIIITTGAAVLMTFTLHIRDSATTWANLTYVASATAPTSEASNGQLWYNSVSDEVDIMIHNGTTWVGYLTGDGLPLTNPLGPIISAVAPDIATGQSDGSAIVDGDIWIDTSDMQMYGKNIYVYNLLNGGWVLQDTTDQSTPDGWLFADARWTTGGDATTAGTITALLDSDYLDPDAPDPSLYPRGMRLWNTRRSGFNVKMYVTDAIDRSENNGDNKRYPHDTGESMSAYTAPRWVSQNNVAEDGSGLFGANSQRAQVVNSLKELIDSNSGIRDTDTLNFNLLATPGYPEAIQNMVALNTDRGLTAFVIGDTPFRLEPTGTALSNWGMNTAGAFDNGDEGAVSYDEYMAMYYPSGYTNDNTGNKIVVPPSHMMLRTFINSDAKSFQWFAPAGTRRGGVDNATSVGYITTEGEFKTTALHQGLRDVLDTVKINPIATLTGVGILAYGQRTRARNASALDRINVARLVCYLRRQLDVLSRPFLFEPNDAQTRREIKAAAESLLLELTGQRALYDFIVVCDETNNTPSRIDRSELYMDIAIEPVKAVEFIYIPLRIKNTGDIKAGL